MQHMRGALPPLPFLPLSLSLALLQAGQKGSSPCRLPQTAHTFATLIKRSGLCHTWHAADNSRASVQLQFRLLPASCLCLPACLQPSSCVLPPVIYALNNDASPAPRCAPRRASPRLALCKKCNAQRFVAAAAAVADSAAAAACLACGSHARCALNMPLAASATKTLTHRLQGQRKRERDKQQQQQRWGKGGGENERGKGEGS